MEREPGYSQAFGSKLSKWHRRNKILEGVDGRQYEWRRVDLWSLHGRSSVRGGCRHSPAHRPYLIPFSNIRCSRHGPRAWESDALQLTYSQSI